MIASDKQMGYHSEFMLTIAAAIREASQRQSCIESNAKFQLDVMHDIMHDTIEAGHNQVGRKCYYGRTPEGMYYAATAEDDGASDGVIGSVFLPMKSDQHAYYDLNCKTGELREPLEGIEGIEGIEDLPGPEWVHVCVTARGIVSY